MLGEAPFGAAIPVSDVDRARRFYEGVLGVIPIRVQDAEVVYRAGTTRFGIYQTQAAGKAEHTLGTFNVEDVESMVTELRSRGVRFEEYDMPGLKTVDGIARLGPDKVAWFKDPDGNILSIDDRKEPGSGT